MYVAVGDMGGEGTGLFPREPGESFAQTRRLDKNSESSVTVGTRRQPLAATWNASRVV